MAAPILFRNPTIVSGDPDQAPFVANVLVEDGLIKTIKEGLDVEGATVVESEGFILCPGFIDMHAHSDLYLLSHPDHEPKISQGCTVSHTPARRRRSAVRAAVSEPRVLRPLPITPLH